MEKKIKVENVKMQNRGSYLCSFDVEIVPWKLILKDVRMFKKGEQSWLKMPSQSWKDGEETKFKQLVWFTDPESMRRFQESVCAEADQVLSTMPQELPSFEDEELMF